MGGRESASKPGDRFALLVSVASPHNGARVASLSEAFNLERVLLDDMAPGSGFLASMQNSWNSLARRPPTFCVTSPHDAIVSMDSALFQCDRFERLPEWGHIDLVKPTSAADARYRVVMDAVAARIVG
jgi:hypothetical protein